MIALATLLDPEKRGAAPHVRTSDGRGEVRLWDASTHRPVGKRFPHPGQVTAVTFAPNGRSLLTGCNDGTARLWDVTSARIIREFKPEKRLSPVISVLFGPDGRTILAGKEGDGGKTFWLWDRRRGKRIGAPLRSVNTVVFSPDGKFLLTGRGEADKTRGEARLWSAATGQPVGLPLFHPGMVHLVGFSPDGRTILTGSSDGTVRLWDVATTRPLGAPLHHPDLRALAFRRDARTILALGPGLMRSWKVPAPVTGERARVHLWAEHVTGMRIDPAGGVDWLSTPEWEECRRQFLSPGDSVCSEPTMTAPVQERRPRLTTRSPVAPEAE
jgi:WD40 repeat protein